MSRLTTAIFAIAATIAPYAGACENLPANGIESAEIIKQEYPAWEGVIARLENANSEPFENCAKPAEYDALFVKKSRGYFPKDKRAAEEKVIYLYLAHKNTLETRDCSCAGKVPDFAQVHDIYKRLFGDAPEPPKPAMTYQFNEHRRDMARNIAELCGEAF